MTHFTADKIIAMVTGLVFIAWYLWLRKYAPRPDSDGSYVPRGDRVIVKRLDRPKPEPGGVIIPGSQQKPLDEGIVIAVGPELDDIEVSQHVCFLEFAGTPVEVDGEDLLSLRDCEIHGVRR